MSTIWTIESRAGVVFGDYHGETPKQAFIAMLDDSGDDYGSPTAGTENDWLIYLSKEKEGANASDPDMESCARPGSVR